MNDRFFGIWAARCLEHRAVLLSGCKSGLPGFNVYLLFSIHKSHRTRLVPK
jgi:hypothetical protein